MSLRRSFTSSAEVRQGRHTGVCVDVLETVSRKRGTKVRDMTLGRSFFLAHDDKMVGLRALAHWTGAGD
jgi:hypothetical protein